MAEVKNTNTEDSVENLAESKTLSFKEMRDTFFAVDRMKRKTIVYTLNDIQLEFRQPSFDDFTTAQEGDYNWLIVLLIKHSYVPDTDKLFFTMDDYDPLMNIPMTGQFSQIMTSIQEVLDLKVEEKVKN